MVINTVFQEYCKPMMNTRNVHCQKPTVSRLIAGVMSCDSANKQQYRPVRRPGRGADHPPLLAPRSRESRAMSVHILWALESVTGYLYLF
jgi:hypothetical protein